MADDRIQREIEDILNRLDSFVPEESMASKVRRRSSDVAAAFGRAVIAPFAAISIRNVMLAALVLIVIGFLGMRLHPFVGRWLLIGGVILLVTTFALSLFNRSSSPPVERRWRGRPMDLEGPSFGDRVRAWFQSKRRPRA